MNIVISALSSIQGIINTLLPFTNPETPVLYDALHTVALCTILYFGPRITEAVRQYQAKRLLAASHDDAPQPAEADHDADAVNDAARVPAEALPQRPGPNDDPRPDAAQPPHRPPPFVEPANDIEPGFAPNNFEPGFPPNDDDLDDAGIGPAAPHPNHPPRPSAASRNVGAKKAKSLARRDQRRAYHEFQRAQGEAQRAREREGAAEREAALAEERARREAVARQVEEKERREREERRAVEEEARAAEVRRREEAVRVVREEVRRRGYVRLRDVARRVGMEEGRVEVVVRAAGVLGEKDGMRTMVTGEGYVVRVDRVVMEAAYQKVLHGSTGKVGWEQFGKILQGEIERRAEEVSAR